MQKVRLNSQVELRMNPAGKRNEEPRIVNFFGMNVANCDISISIYRYNPAKERRTHAGY